MTAAMRVSVRDVLWAVCWRTWLKTFRRPVLLTFSFFQPLTWMLFFGFLFHRYGVEEVLPGAAGRKLVYLDFLAPGVSIMTVLFGASQSGIGWIRDLQTGFLSRLLLSPVGPEMILLGKLVADVLRLLGQAGIVLLLAVILGARLDPLAAALPVAIVIVGLFALALSALSCTIALRTQAQEAMAAFVHVVNMPLLFTSTALVPDRQMPGWLAGISAWNPLTMTVDVWRGVFLFDSLPSVWSPLVVLGGVAGLSFWSAVAALRQSMRKGTSA